MIAAYDGYVGGVPDAEIYTARISPWVIHINTIDLACGIDYASRHRNCDVISLSHGGSPSYLWAEVVNAAYDRGTAMFAAEGDFVSLLSHHPGGIIIPPSPVYPAAFRRVVGVVGMTADYRSYAQNDLKRLLRHPGGLVTG